MLEEGHIQRCANGVRLIGIEYDLAAVVAFLQRGEDIGRVIATIAVVGNMASLVSDMASRKRIEGSMRFASFGPQGPLALDSNTE